MTYQVRTKDYGLCLLEAPTAEEALCRFVAEYKLRAEVRDTLEVVPLYYGAADDVHRLYSGVCVDI